MKLPAAQASNHHPALQVAGLGADEVMLYCYGTDPGQVDRLAVLAG